MNKIFIAGEKILIATGTRPKIPSIAGLEETDYITSDEALRLKHQPATLTIIGGGYKPVRSHHFFGAVGTKINIIPIDNILLPMKMKTYHRILLEFSRKNIMYF